MIWDNTVKAYHHNNTDDIARIKENNVGQLHKQHQLYIIENICIKFTLCLKYTKLFLEITIQRNPYLKK